MRSILNALQDGRLFELPETGKARALEFLARVLDANPDIEVGTDALEEIQQREIEYNTGIGMGVGVPHLRARREEGELYCAIGWSSQGIDYGASDGEPVHLVLMYYIPGAQKSIYLKEISSLVKAMKKSGGIGPIAHADHLNVVRNLLLDWVSEVLGDSGPEAVARMIKLEVKSAQGPVAVPAPAPAEAVVAAALKHRAVPFSVLVANQQSVVLGTDSDWVTLIEKDATLAQKLVDGASFVSNGRHVFVTGVSTYAAGRALYQCVAISGEQASRSAS